MTWSLSPVPTPVPSLPELPLAGEPRRGDVLLAAAQAEALDAMGVGVVLCDRSLRVLAASPLARTLLGRIEPGAGDQLPEAIASALRAWDRWPVRVRAGDQDVVVRARASEVAWTSIVVWLAVEGDAGELDATLRKRYRLTRRQLDLVHQLRQGFRNQEIATNLGLTCSTVKSYLSHLFDTLGVKSRGEAIALIERARRGE